MERRDRPMAAIAPNEPISDGIVHPREKDVLAGNGKRYHNKGNLRQRSLVKGMFQAYDNGSFEVRRTLVDCVIHSIEESGGLFRKQEQNWSDVAVWKEMPKDQCRKIVAQAFRNSYRRRTNKTTSST